MHVTTASVEGKIAQRYSVRAHRAPHAKASLVLRRTSSEPIRMESQVPTRHRDLRIEGEKMGAVRMGEVVATHGASQWIARRTVNEKMHDGMCARKEVRAVEERVAWRVYV